MDPDPPGNQESIARTCFDSQGRKLLPENWEYAVKLGKNPECVWDPKGPGDFLFQPRFFDAHEMIRVEYQFESGDHAQLIENDRERKVYELSAPGGQIDLPTSSVRNTWTWRLPADTHLSSKLLAWRWDSADEESDSLPRDDRGVVPRCSLEESRRWWKTLSQEDRNRVLWGRPPLGKPAKPSDAP